MVQPKSNKELARQVHSRRRQLRISQSTLAEMAGISRTYVSQIERGEATNVSLGVLKALAAALGITVPQLTGDIRDAPTFIPPALRELAIRQRLRFEVVDRLARIPSRGKEPHSPEEWSLLYEAVRPYLD